MRHLPLASRRARAAPAIAATLAVAVAAAAALAQPAASPVTEADLERARRSAPVVTDADIERARRLHAPASAAALPRAAPSAVDVDALPVPSAPASVDLGAIARDYATLGAPGAAAPRAHEPALLVFVSLSLPEPTLALLVEQAARSRATLVLRGVHDDSLARTVARVRALIGQHAVGFQIDPQAFSRYAVTVVPTFVVVRGGLAPDHCAAQACPGDAFVGVAGDVSIDYALEHVARHEPAFAADAAHFLARLRRTP